MSRGLLRVVFAFALWTAAVVGSGCDIVQEVSVVSGRNEAQEEDQVSAARECLISYLSVDCVEERWLHVRQLPGLRMRMDKSLDADAEAEWMGGITFLPGAQFSEMGATKFLFLPYRAHDGRVRDIAFELTLSGPKLDWDYLFGFPGAAWKNFLESHSTDEPGGSYPVILEPSDYFNWEFASSDQYSCYLLSHPRSDVRCFGYAKVNSEVNEELIRILKKNAELGYPNAKAILALKRNSIPRVPLQVAITGVVSEEWLIPFPGKHDR